MILEINTLCDQAIYEQLKDQIILGIASGQLQTGEALPSVRRLGADLGVNLHTVNKAYTALCDEGYVAIDRRKGVVIAAKTPSDAVFTEQLSRRLTQAAAEAICRKLSEQDFLTLCTDCYRSVGSQNEQKGGESK